MARAKSGIITFKTDATLLEAMKGVPNRSKFIRDAILAALDSACPVCCGTGVLSLRQREHWAAFAASHSIEECGDCHELHLVCENAPRRGRPRGRTC